MPRTKEELAKLTVAELKSALKDLGLPVSGRKEELVERLASAQDNTPQAAETVEAATTQSVPPAVASLPVSTVPAATQNGTQAALAESAVTHDVDPAASVPTKESKREKIVFSETTLKQMPAKITVVRPSDAPSVKTEAQKRKERAERFKDPEVEKTRQRAERFGTSHPDIEKERARKRAEKFGVVTEEMEQERKRKRAERFGVDDPKAKLAARAERFGVVGAALASVTN